MESHSFPTSQTTNKGDREIGAATTIILHDDDTDSSELHKTKPRGPFCAWLPEIAWCFASIALFAILVAVLVICNDKPLPEWPRGVTLNTIVALLTTFCRMAFFIAVTEAISQWKWNWFATARRPRPLKDLNVLDSASRGAGGSIKAVVRSRGNIFGILSATILVTGLVTSTLSQAAVSFPIRLVPSPTQNATTFSRQDFPDMDREKRRDAQSFVDKTTRTFFQAIFSTPNHPRPFPEPTCPSSECTWPPFTSLGLCASVANVTSFLTVEPSGGIDHLMSSLRNENYTATLQDIQNVSVTGEKLTAPMLKLVSPNPPAFNDGRGSAKKGVYVPPSAPAGFPARLRVSLAWRDFPDLLDAVVSQFFLFYSNDLTEIVIGKHKRPGRILFKDSFRAAEVIWHFCVQTYNVSVSNGVSSTQLLSAETKVVDRVVSKEEIAFTLASRGPFRGEGRKEEKALHNVRIDLHEVSSFDKNMREAFEGELFLGEAPLLPYRTEPSQANRAMGSWLYDTQLYPRGRCAGLSPESCDERVFTGLKNLTEGMAGAVSDQKWTGTCPRGLCQNPMGVACLSGSANRPVDYPVASVAIQTSRLGVDVVKSSALAGVFAMTVGLSYNPDKRAVAKLGKDEVGEWKLGVEETPLLVK
ncbi:hypothetical protein QBC35DRAFT_454281 [Podospora australis]|uniref:Uncharacterized protein n=1 Tax=Podospora australis TaxID=1536484 RepID=A0AAN7AFK1_9PEZI|nr:hypothetical protein QBC35DRAFT_454281 [Podospora australis]